MCKQKKDLEGSDLGLIDALSQNLPGGTRPMFRLKFEPSASRIQVKSVTAMAISSTGKGRNGVRKRKKDVMGKERKEE
jgi:hypothetical protein